MQPVRLFVDAPLEQGASLRLDPERSHYLSRVLRLRRDAALTLFNGNGACWIARLDRADSKHAEVTVLEPGVSEPEPVCALHLVQALLKSDRLDYVLQKATELGATDIWLVHGQRTEVRIRPERLTTRLNHWRRVIQSACEQCGRLRVPALHGPGPLSELLNAPPAPTGLMLDPGGGPLVAPGKPVDVALYIGPEGGFDDAERAAAQRAGVSLVGVGGLVLRADTAPVVGLSLIRQGWAWHAP